MRASPSFAALLLALLAAGCTDSARVAAVAAPTTIAPRLELDGSAYEAAQWLELPEPAPMERDGLHHVFALSDNILSGAEPHDEASLQALADLGVRTILSVDGKLPDAAGAERLGMRYVHVPIQYRGMTDDELLAIAKTFRELPGPFYVHCFHGVHRGPAAAAVGRLVLDGVSREQALAEMRQWCGTSSKYEGLYGVVALGDIPSAEQTAAYPFDFPSSHVLGGLRQAMVSVSRAFGRIEEMADNDWQVNPDHPDVDPANEAAIVAGLLGQCGELPGDQLGVEPGDDWAALMQASQERADALGDVITAARGRASDDVPVDWSDAGRALKELKTSCTACHSAYRNE